MNLHRHLQFLDTSKVILKYIRMSEIGVTHVVFHPDVRFFKAEI